MGKIISFGNQKGGVGKSTVTSMVANFIHTKFKDKGVKVLVVDADDLQNTLFKIRMEEMKELEELEESENDESKKPEKIDPYELLRMNSKDLVNNIETLKDEYDYIFIDLPGNLKQEGVIGIYAYVDALFIPTQPSRVDLDSTVDFVQFYDKHIMNKRKEMGFDTVYCIFFNRVLENNKDFKEIYNSRHKFGIPIMDNYLNESIVTFQRQISTINMYNSASRGNYELFVDEMFKIINHGKN